MTEIEERYRRLLDVYDLEEILDNIGLEPMEVLLILDEYGYLTELTLPEPL